MTVITDPKFAPARVLDPERFNEVLNRFALYNGAGSENGEMPANKRLCVMEATAYILGYDTISDSPPCTSPVIRELMIAINDGTDSQVKRNKLKKIIPDIVNTAPTKWTAHKQPRLVTVEKDPRFQRAEDTRREMIAEKTSRSKIQHGLRAGQYKTYKGIDAIVRWNMPRIEVFVRELAAVAKFDSAAEPVVFDFGIEACKDI